MAEIIKHSEQYAQLHRLIFRVKKQISTYGQAHMMPHLDEICAGLTAELMESTVRDYIFMLHKELWAQKLKTVSVEEVDIKYPENWWEALKDRFMPKFLRRWFPVKYVEIKHPGVELDLVTLYPGIAAPEQATPILAMIKGGFFKERELGRLKLEVEKLPPLERMKFLTCERCRYRFAEDFEYGEAYQYTCPSCKNEGVVIKHDPFGPESYKLGDRE